MAISSKHYNFNLIVVYLIVLHLKCICPPVLAIFIKENAFSIPPQFEQLNNSTDCHC